MGTLVFQATLGGAVNIIGPNIANTINFTLPSADGTSGQTWTTNGSGVLAFGTLGVAGGGTGLTTLATGSLSYGAGTSAFSTLAIGTAGQILTVNSGATAPQWSTLTGVAVTTFSAGTTGLTPSSATAGAVTLAGTLVAANGGTGQSSYAVGDLLYASTTTALSKLADVATGNALISGGVGVAPSWGKIGLTTHVSGTLPTANGGTNLTSFTANGVVYASSTSALATGSALQFDGTSFAVGGSAYSSSTISANYTTPASGSQQTFLGATDATKAFKLSQTGSAFSYAGVGSNELWYYVNSSFSALTFGSDGSVPIKFVTGFSEGMRLNSTGLGIGTSSPAYPLHVEKSKAGDALVSFKNTSATGDGLIIQVADNAYNAFRIFDSAGSPSFRVKGSGETYVAGNLGVGTSSPTEKLQVTGTADVKVILDSTAGAYTSTLELKAAGGGGSVVAALGGSNNLILRTNSVDRVNLDSSGNLLVGTTSAVSGGGVLQVSNGITFPATQSASSNANTLDDYEEGTWTPSLGGTATYTNQTGTYTKIGRQVTVIFDITVLLLGTGSTELISGLPFTANSSQNAGSVAYFANLAVNVISITCYVEPTGTRVGFNSSAAASGTATNNPSIFGNSTRIIGTITYFV